MGDPTDSAAGEAKRARMAFMFQLVGASDSVIGLGVIYGGSKLVPGVDAIWWGIGTALVVFGLVLVIVGRRVDPRNRAL
jgi:Na+-driven multidrug efflux pump